MDVNQSRLRLVTRSFVFLFFDSLDLLFFLPEINNSIFLFFYLIFKVSSFVMLKIRSQSSCEMKKGGVSGCYVVFVLVHRQSSTIAIMASESCAVI